MKKLIAYILLGLLFVIQIFDKEDKFFFLQIIIVVILFFYLYFTDFGESKK